MRSPRGCLSRFSRQPNTPPPFHLLSFCSALSTAVFHHVGLLYGSVTWISIVAPGSGSVQASHFRPGETPMRQRVYREPPSQDSEIHPRHLDLSNILPYNHWKTHISNNALPRRNTRPRLGRCRPHHHRPLREILRLLRRGGPGTLLHAGNAA